MRLAIDNDVLMVGAFGVDQPPVDGCGATYVFQRALFADGFESGDTGAWSPVMRRR